MQDQYVAVTVTLTTKDTNYNLMELVQAIAPNAPQACRELTVQPDPDDASGATVAVGDALMDANRRGYKLAKGESKTYRSEGGDRVYPGTKYVRANQDNALLNVEIEKG